MYRVTIKCNYSGFAASDNDSSVGFQTSENVKTLKEARAKAAEFKKKFYGKSGYCDIDILDIKKEEYIYTRRYGKEK